MARASLFGWLLFFSTMTSVADEAALESIRIEDLKKHIETLSDDSFEGREAGSRGGRAAGNYLLQEIQKHKIAGGGENGGYWQYFGDGHRNLLCLIEGADPQLQGELIIVGGHYDHVGYGTRRNSRGPIGYIHNGADDNASGVAAMLETLEALQKLPENQRPKRSLLFAFWDGEEKGLLGSKHWVAQKTLPDYRVALTINIDMIGRLRDKVGLEIIGTRTAEGYRRRVSRLNIASDLPLRFPWLLKGNSDHHSFYTQGMPALMLHTGLHEEYHRPSDDHHLLNYPGLQKITQLLFSLVQETANADELPGFRASGRREGALAQRRMEAAQPDPQPRLGVSWEAAEDGAAMILKSISPGSPAAVAGLQAGDRIVQFAEKPFSSDAELRKRILASPAETSVTILRQGEQEPQPVPLKLRGSPLRIGIAWREDKGEPGTVVVSRVVWGSAAQQAGLKVRDRIYRIQGERFQDSDELAEKLRALPAPIELLVERQGRLRKTTLHPLN